MSDTIAKEENFVSEGWGKDKGEGDKRNLSFNLPQEMMGPLCYTEEVPGDRVDNPSAEEGENSSQE